VSGGDIPSWPGEQIGHTERRVGPSWRRLASSSDNWAGEEVKFITRLPGLMIARWMERRALFKAEIPVSGPVEHTRLDCVLVLVYRSHRAKVGHFAAPTRTLACFVGRKHCSPVAENGGHRKQVGNRREK